MRSTLSRCVDIYQNQGTVTLVKKVHREIYEIIFSYIVWNKEKFGLSIDGTTVQFSTETASLIKRTRDRVRTEQDILLDLKRELDTGDVFYDIGANTGIYSLFAANWASTGDVIAFEPYPPNVNILKKQIRMNGLDNIEVIKTVLSDSEENVEFEQPVEPDVGYGSASISSERSSDSTTVSATTGDKLISDSIIPAPNVVKIDVEGAESLVISGLSEALRSEDCRVVYCEIHLDATEYRPSTEDFGATPERVREQLRKMGFDISVIVERGDTELFLKATK